MYLPFIKVKGNDNMFSRITKFVTICTVTNKYM